MFQLKKRTQFVLIIVSFVCLVSLINPKSVQAQEGINIQPILPSNQKSDVKGYFNLIMRKNQTQTIFITLQNQGKEEKTLQIFSSNALTNQNGGIHYTVGEGSPASYSIDTDYLLKQHIKVQQTITLPPQSQKRVPIVLHSPQKEGTYLGSILFSENGKEKSKENEKSLAITQESLFGIALQMTVGKEKKGEVSYKKTDVTFSPSGVYMRITLENGFPQVLQDIKGSYVVKKDGTPVLKGVMDSFKMAPMSGVQYTIPWNAKEIEKGNYQFDMTVSSNGKEQHIQESLTVKESELHIYENKKKPKSNVPQVKEKTTTNNQHIWWWMAGGMALFSLGWYIGRRKPNNTNSEK